jgi:CubicO group peptidase (beta-lactamase class C family)
MNIGSLAAAIQPFVDDHQLAGAVLLAATRDRILALEACGYADLATQRPLTTDALFWIASMTKPMTAAALMMLVDEGKVNVDDPVEKYLPEFLGQMVIVEKDEEHMLLRKPRHPILVREVLNHTAGLAFSNPVESPTFDRFALRDSVRSHAMRPLLSEPGTKYLYSNAGTNTAGRIIEVVSGMAYEDFMDERLFRPLGMSNTTFWPTKGQLTRFATIYQTNADRSGLEETTLSQLAYPFNNRARHPRPAGGLFSIAEDCATFCQMVLKGGELRGRRYVSEASVREMTRRQTAPEIETSYGFCWGQDGEAFQHGGAYKTNMMIDPKKGLITVILLHLTNDWRTEAGSQVNGAFRAAAEKLL